MSERDRSSELIRELARDAEPVRRIPRIRTVALLVLGVWIAVASAGALLKGVRPGLPEVLLMDWGVAAVFGGLLGAGIGGLVAALAMGVPGREALARFGLLGSGLCMAIAAGVGTLLFLENPSAPTAPYQADLSCLLTACVVAALPALGIVWFGGRAAPHRPVVLVLAAAAAAAALGAASAQASCPYADFRHLMMGHVLAPVASALLLTLPLLVALRRASR